MKEDKKIYSVWEYQKKKHKKLLFVLWVIFCALLFLCMLVCLITREWAGTAVVGAVLLFYVGLGFLLPYASSSRRVELYADRVLFIGEQSWPKPLREARYEDIVGACINAADEYGDHVRDREWNRELDTLCVYCKRGEYILYGVHGWNKEYARALLEELLSRAGVSESEPEEGEYGAESAAAREGFAALGVEEEEEDEGELLYESIPPRVKLLASRMPECFRNKASEERALPMLRCLCGKRLKSARFERTYNFFLEEGADDFVLLELGDFSLCVFGGEDFCDKAQALCGSPVTGIEAGKKGVALLFEDRRLDFPLREGERVFALYCADVPVAGAEQRGGVQFYSADEETI